MPDQHDSAQRPRPFAPPVPPFRGPATAARPALTPLSQPNGSRPPAPFVARRAARVEDEPDAVTAVPPTIAAVATDAAPAHEPQTPPAALTASAPVPAPAPQPGADAHLYGHDPFRVPTPVHVPARVEALPTPMTAPEADAEDAATALAGLPYFDDTGSEHQPGAQRAPSEVSGKVHRVEFDPAAVLESIAGRIRGGLLALPDLDPLASDEATLAAILCALLRDSRR